MNGDAVNPADQHWPWLLLLPLGAINRRGMKGLVPKLSPIFCATGLDCVQLSV